MMQTGTADIMVQDMPRHFFDGANVVVDTLGIPALEHLASAVRQQRVTDGYRRLLQAIRDESWMENEE